MYVPAHNTFIENAYEETLGYPISVGMYVGVKIGATKKA
jgi:hypothetical protein